MRTPAKAVLAVPTRALGEAIAAEWEAQGERIDPATMPLTRLVNSALDGVRGREAAVREDIAKYRRQRSAVLPGRASPRRWLRRQAELWDPILAWSREALGAHFVVAEGIMPVEQPQAAKAAVARALAGFDAFALTALHVMTTLTGSALLALAHARGRLDAEAAWAAAHVDEDWQIGQAGARTPKPQPAASAAGSRCRPPAGCWPCSATHEAARPRRVRPPRVLTTSVAVRIAGGRGPQRRGRMARRPVQERHGGIGADP